MKEVKWGKFEIKDVFKPLVGRNKLSKLDLSTSGSIPVYSSDTTNSGIVGFTEKQPDYKITRDVPAYLIFGDHTKSMNIATSDFCVMDNIKVLIPLTHSIPAILFICAVWEKTIPDLGYNRHWSKAKESILYLPISNNKDPDFDFMESFIAELETNHIAELEAYLIASGLKDYTLTDKEKQVLSSFKQGKIAFNEFKIERLFEINSYKKRFDANKVIISEVGHPYVVRTSLNNGIRGFINEDEKYLNKGNTISFGQDTATVFYQEKPYFTGDKIKIVESKDSRFNKLSALFFVSAIAKSFSSFAWGASNFNVKTIESQLVNIPTQNKQPDYEIMEILISAVQKLVIKDVVLYSNNKLAAAKTITSKRGI